ncbi:MAG: class C sortase [Lachnospiraceae bacterium]|nr:class C sortase [Lachnospiraceae bacterium]
MGKSRGIVRGLLVLLTLGIALALMSYPFVANYIFENRTDSIVSAIERSVQDAEEDGWKTMIEQAREYNHVLSGGAIQLRDPFVEEASENTAGDYDSLLCMTDDGVMGFIEIPSVSLALPIYHGTSDQVLEKGAGHLQGTSLPVGGESTHTVLTGHSGLSSAKLFTDLAELKEEDVFFLNVMGEKLAYKVDRIKVVLPNELNDLYVEKGKDYCTLLTCTPYGVNTHRLLVRGERTEYLSAVNDPEVFQKKKEASKWMAEYKRALSISIIVFLTGAVLMFLIRYFSGPLDGRDDRQRKNEGGTER